MIETFCVLLLIAEIHADSCRVFLTVHSSVVDPKLFFSDPDPDPALGLISDPDPDPACLTKVIRLYKIKL